MNSNEKLRDEQIAQSVWNARYGNTVARQMVQVLNSFDAEIQARILVAIDDMDATSFTITRLDALLGSVRATNKEAVQAMIEELLNEMNEFSGASADAQQSIYESAIPSSVLDLHPLIGITQEQVYAAAVSEPFQGKLLSEWASDLEDDRLARIRNAVRIGFMAGDTTAEIAKSIRGHANQGYKDGALQMSRTNAMSIARTAIAHTAAVARTQFASNNDDLIKGKQWLSTLDGRTSHWCQVRDHLKYTLENQPIGHKVPYLQGPGRIHFGCRSTETYILKSDEELGIPLSSLTPAARASMDGEVPADTTYAEWFNRQDYSRQKQIVGDTRAKLIRDGGMSPSELYSDKGEWLTIDQLKQRVPDAFDDAGVN